MIRMLIVGYVFAIRSERLLCREVQVNLAYRWFCGLSIETRQDGAKRRSAGGSSASNSVAGSRHAPLPTCANTSKNTELSTVCGQLKSRRELRTVHPSARALSALRWTAPMKEFLAWY
jgi:hypothetical protein